MSSEQNTHRKVAAQEDTSDEGNMDDEIQTNGRQSSLNNDGVDGNVKADLDVDLANDDSLTNSSKVVMKNKNEGVPLISQQVNDESSALLSIQDEMNNEVSAKASQIQLNDNDNSSDLIKEREKRAGSLLRRNVPAKAPASMQRSSASSVRSKSETDVSDQWVKHYIEHAQTSNNNLNATNIVAKKKSSQNNDDDLIKEQEKRSGSLVRRTSPAQVPASMQRSSARARSTSRRISVIDACVEPGSFASDNANNSPQQNMRAKDGDNNEDKDKQNDGIMAEIAKGDELLSNSQHSRLSTSQHSRQSYSGDDEKARERAARHAARRAMHTPRLVSSTRSSIRSSSVHSSMSDNTYDKTSSAYIGNSNKQVASVTLQDKRVSFASNNIDDEADDEENIPELEYDDDRRVRADTNNIDDEADGDESIELEYYEDRCKRADANMFEENYEAAVQPGAYHVGDKPEEDFNDSTNTITYMDSGGGGQYNNDTSALLPITQEKPSSGKKHDLIKATMVEDIVIPRAMAVSEVTQKWRKIFCIFWGSVIAIPVLCAVVVLAVKFFKGEPDESVPSSMPSAAPSPSPTSTAQGIIESMYPEMIEAFTNSDSHQSKALHWIENAYGGKSEISLPDYRIVQRFVLACLYYATAGERWITSEYWLTEENECTWFEPTQDVFIKCDEDNVIHDLTIRHNRLKGPFCPEISLLSNLRSLDLSNNRIEGSLPTELGLMSSVEKLSFGGNRLYGSIPTELSLLSNNLSELRLDVNTITGTLPSVLGLMTSLSVLQLSDNILFGHIPTVIGLLSNLALLSLEENSLSGLIPSQLSGLVNLEALGLGKNDLTGLLPSIPSRDQQPSSGQFFSMLKYLSLESNSISGTIPDVFKKMTNLETINLGYNALSGSLPAHTESWLKLRSINLESNYLLGELPSQIGMLTELESLNLRGNRITGALPSQLYLLPRLKTVDIQNNKIRGSLPSFLGEMSSLESLDMRRNELAGALPSEMGSLTNLKYLALGGNVGLSGTIPTVLGRLTNLETLLLNPGLDQLTGPVPTEVCDLRRNFSLDNFIISSCHDMKCDCCHDHCPLLPNSKNDNNDNNGSLSCPTGSSLLQIVIGTDGNPEGLQWVVKKDDSATTTSSSSSSSSSLILLQDGPYTSSKDRHQTIVREVCVPDDTCAHFTILNANADGTIVGSLGGGDHYTIYYVNKEEEDEKKEMIASGVAYAHVNEPIPIIIGKDCHLHQVVETCSEDNNKVMLRIEMTLEKDPQRTSWSVDMESSNSSPPTNNLLLLEGGPYEETDTGTTIVKRTCVNIDSCIKFQMEDESSSSSTGAADPFNFDSILTNVKLFVNDTVVGGVVYVGSPTTVWQGTLCGFE